MCSFTSRFRQGVVDLCAALCCTLCIAGCVRAETRAPADFDGYAVCAYDDTACGDVRWADYLADHLVRRARGGVRVRSGGQDRDLFRIEVRMNPLSGEDFRVERNRKGVRLTASDKEGMLWLQYQLMKQLGREDSRIEASDLPPATVGLQDTSGVFAFDFRSIYHPALLDADYAGITAAHDVENSWGLWGHALKKAVGTPSSEEIRATVNGAKYDGQYCLSSQELFRRIEAYVIDHYGSGEETRIRFMIAPDDDEAVCTCDACRAAGNTPQNGTPAAAKLTARLAERFPGHTFYLLSYLGTAEAPAKKLPANAGAVVSAMKLPMRTHPADTPAGTAFAERLAAWRGVTDSLFVWDYTNNFDDYLTPFPILELLRERLRFYRDSGVRGVFLNGSGYDYCTFGDMQGYVLSALLLDPEQAVEPLMHAYFDDRYPTAGDMLYGFCRNLEHRTVTDKKTLNLYGGIRDAERTYLDAAEFVPFYDALQNTLQQANGEERKRLHELLTALSYTRLEIARQHASDAFGCAELQNGRLRIRPAAIKWSERLGKWKSFPAMKHVGESGFTIEAYLSEWQRCMKAGPNLMTGCRIRPVSQPDEGYDDLSCLSDGIPALPGSYHYGWHIATGDLEVELPAERATGARMFRMTFLHDPGHRILAPHSVEIWTDGIRYRTLTPVPDDTGRLYTIECAADLEEVGNIRVKALRAATGRTQTATDEIYLIPRP